MSTSPRNRPLAPVTVRSPPASPRQHVVCDITVKPHAAPHSQRHLHWFMRHNTEEDQKWAALAQQEARDEAAREAERKAHAKALKAAMARGLDEQLRERERAQRAAAAERQQQRDEALRAAAYLRSDKLDGRARELEAQSQQLREAEAFRALFNATHPEGSLAKHLIRKENIFMQRAYEIVAAHEAKTTAFFAREREQLLHAARERDVELQRCRERMRRLEDDIEVKRAEVDRERLERQHLLLENAAAARRLEEERRRAEQRSAAAASTEALRAAHTRDLSPFETKPFPFNRGPPSPRLVAIDKAAQYKLALDAQVAEQQRLALASGGSLPNHSTSPRGTPRNSPRK